MNDAQMSPFRRWLPFGLLLIGVVGLYLLDGVRSLHVIGYLATVFLLVTAFHSGLRP